MSPQPSQRSYLERNTASAAWFDALVNETTTMEHLGVHAAMFSVRLFDSDTRSAAQARTLFGLILRPTDHVEQTSPTSFSLLLAPQKDLAETVVRARAIADAFDDANILASTGFAQRRQGESLLDTWARAEAQLDRAAYRTEHHDGITLT
jgi:hypothetical protein